MCLPAEHAKRFTEILKKEHGLSARKVGSEVRIDYPAGAAGTQKVLGAVKSALQKFTKEKGIQHETGSRGHYFVRFVKR